MPARSATERPIIFGADSVRAILSGQKTQTRRMVTPQPDERWGSGIAFAKNGLGVRTDAYHVHARVAGEDRYIYCPYGVPGDRLWVRETLWRNGGYVADGPSKVKNDGKVPAIFMVRRNSRITLEVTAVRVERLNSISEEDAKAEGVMHGITFGPGIEPPPARDAFEAVWDSINGKAGRRWADNPYIWAITFKRVQP